MIIVPHQPLKAIRPLGLPWWVMVMIVAAMFWQYLRRRVYEIWHNEGIILPLSFWFLFPNEDSGSLVFTNRFRKIGPNFKQYELCPIPKTFSEVWEALRNIGRTRFTCREILVAFPCGCEERVKQTSQPASDEVIQCETCGQYHKGDGRSRFRNCLEHGKIYALWPDASRHTFQAGLSSIEAGAMLCGEVLENTLTSAKEDILCPLIMADNIRRSFHCYEALSLCDKYRKRTILSQQWLNLLARRIWHPYYAKRTLEECRHLLRRLDRTSVWHLRSVLLTGRLLQWLAYALLTTVAILLWWQHQPDWKTIAEIAYMVVAAMWARRVRNWIS